MLILVIIAGIMQSKQVQRRHASMTRALHRHARRIQETFSGAVEEPVAGYVPLFEQQHHGPPLERIPEREPDARPVGRANLSAPTLAHGKLGAAAGAGAGGLSGDEQRYSATPQGVPPAAAEDPVSSGYQPLPMSDPSRTQQPPHNDDIASDAHDQDVASFGHILADQNHVQPPPSTVPASMPPGSSCSVDFSSALASQPQQQPGTLGGIASVSDSPFASTHQTPSSQQVKLPRAALTTAVLPQHALKKSPAIASTRSGPSASSSSMSEVQPFEIDPFEGVPSFVQRRAGGARNAAGAMLVPVNSGDKRPQSMWERLFNVESLDESDCFQVLESQLSTVASECHLPDSVVKAMVTSNRKGGLMFPLRVDKYYVSDILKVSYFIRPYIKSLCSRYVSHDRETARKCCWGCPCQSCLDVFFQAITNKLSARVAALFGAAPIDALRRRDPLYKKSLSCHR